MPSGSDVFSAFIAHGQVVNCLCGHIDHINAFATLYAKGEGAGDPLGAWTEKVCEFDVCGVCAGLTQCFGGV